MEMTTRGSKPSSATPEEKREIAQALRDFYETVVPDYREKGTELLHMLGLPDEILRKTRNVDEFVEEALEDGDVTREVISEAKAFVAEFQRDPLRYIKPAWREILKGMPRVRGGGRSRLIKTEEEAQKLRDQVNELILNGKTTTGVALRRVAQRNGVKLRTMQRIWHGKKKVG